MYQILIMAAKMFTEEDLVMMIQKNIAEYNNAPSLDTFRKIGMTAQLIALRCATEGKDMFEAIKEMEQKKAVVDMYEKSAM